MRVRSLEPPSERLGEALHAAAPPRPARTRWSSCSPTGQRNSAYYEHAAIAGHSGCRWCAPRSCRFAPGGCSPTLDGGSGRSTSSTAARTRIGSSDERGSADRLAECCSARARRATLACVNAFGTGVADDKLVHGYVEEMVRFYLGEEPLLASVPTYDLSQPGVLEMVLERIGELVVKPRSGHGGMAS